MEQQQPLMMPQALPAAQLKDLELVKWLDHKLGDSNDLWCGRMAASFLSQHMIEELENCFQALEPHVKLKLITAIPHINYRLMNAWRVPLNNLLDLARRDADDWVETISEMYREVPSSGVIIPDRVNQASYFYRTLEELRITMRHHSSQGNLKLLPPSYDFVGQSIIKERLGVGEVEVVKHFNLRKRAKSYILKADVLRGIEAQANPKKDKVVSSSSYPIRIRSTLRKPNNDLPMKGIPTANTCKLSAGFTNEPKKFQRSLAKREGGAKLIDITEIPQAMKLKKKEQDEQDKKRKAEEKEETKAKAIRMKEEKKAAVLKAQQEAKEAAEAKRQAAIEAAAAEADAAAAALTNVDEPMSPEEWTSSVRTVTGNPKRTRKPPGKNEPMPLLSPKALTPALTQQQVAKTMTVKQSPEEQPMLQQEKRLSHQNPGPSTSQPAAPNYLNLQLHSTINVEPQRPPQPAQAMPTLTPQQHAELMDILNTSTCLDSVSERWIVNFMSGNRVNPRPELGSLISIKLHESIENGIFADGTLARLKVETVFEMNYDNGQWRRVKRARLCTNEELQRDSQNHSNLQFPQQFVQEQLQHQLQQQQQRPQESQMRQPPPHTLHHHPHTPIQQRHGTIHGSRPFPPQVVHVQGGQVVHGNAQRPLHHQGPPPLHHPQSHLDHRY